MNNKINIKAAGKTFGDGEGGIVALQDVNLSIGSNEFVTFVGASGCGKSTLLRCIGGLETLTSGSIEIDGAAIDGPGVDRAMVFQHYSLYPWLTVTENIKFSRLLRAGREDITSADVEAASGRADALINLMGLDHVRDAYPNQLSGGMQQSPGFLQQKKAILTRIRETAGMRTDYELLERMTRQAEQHLQ